MANIVWPDDLPTMPLYDGYQESPPNLVLRTQMDAGMAKVRRRYTVAPRPVRVLLSLDDAGVAALDEFFVTTLQGGADRFEWVHPRTGETADYRFVEPPRYVSVGPALWRAQLNLELMPA